MPAGGWERQTGGGAGVEGREPVVFSEMHDLKESLRVVGLLLVCETFILQRKELYLYGIKMLSWFFFCNMPGNSEHIFN